VFNLVIARRAFPPSLLGKATTTIHLVLIVWVIGCNYLHTVSPWTNYLLGATVVLVIASALHYLYWMRSILSDEENV
jgi:phosphatidylglycerophosphate synthase